ncbi:MAG: threonine synthase [Thermodesulfobacteriota bacterium]
MGFLSHLECSRCGKCYPKRGIYNLCQCGGPLLVRYRLEDIQKSILKEDLETRDPTLWKYREFLPIEGEEGIVSLKEGFTPISKLDGLGRTLGLDNLYLKDEGQIPTGTFKARGAAVGVSKAKELGIKTIALPTAGNAGGAWAAYCAKAGIELFVVMPIDAPDINKRECLAMGCHLYLVRGLISDAGKIVKRGVGKYGWFSASTLQEPYRIEGKKTMGLEIAEQFRWSLPHVIVYPCGGGVGLIGIWKAFEELREMGWIRNVNTRLVAVQSAGCAPIVKAFERGKKEVEFWEGAGTIADGLRVPKPLGDFLILDALEKSSGTALSVKDEEILESIQLLAEEEGIFACPEGAATLWAVKKLKDDGWLKGGETILLLNTGTGLKYPQLISEEAPILEADGEITL